MKYLSLSLLTRARAIASSLGIRLTFACKTTSRGAVRYALYLSKIRHAHLVKKRDRSDKFDASEVENVRREVSEGYRLVSLLLLICFYRVNGDWRGKCWVEETLMGCVS